MHVRVCVCLFSPVSFLSPLSLASKALYEHGAPERASERLLLPHHFPCDSINRSIYIAFHGWALSQYFRGPPVNWPLIIHRSLVRHIRHIAYGHQYEPARHEKHNSRFPSVVFFLWFIVGVLFGDKKTETRRSWSPMPPFSVHRHDNTFVCLSVMTALNYLENTYFTTWYEGKHVCSAS